jgi:small GTP-binding protein
MQPGPIQKKVCLLGAAAVGKTSLVSRFVNGIFSEKYLTTVGVKIDKKSIRIAERDLNLILWDLAGEDEFLQVRTSYLRGSAGYLLVADGTRSATLDTALDLHKRAVAEVGNVPFVLVINKSDVMADWEIEGTQLDRLSSIGWQVVRTSAKSGDGVEQAFATLGLKTTIDDQVS